MADHASGMTATCRRARVSVRAHGLEVVDPGSDALDLLRAGCAAAWAAADRQQSADGGPPPDVTAVVEALRGLESDAGWAR